MRNLALARAAAAPQSRRVQRDRPPTVEHAEWGLLVAHVAGHPNAAGQLRELESFRDLLLPEVRSRVAVLAYERVPDVLRQHGLDELASWLGDRIDLVRAAP